MNGIIKYGPNGLKINFYNNGTKMDEILISNNPQKILTFFNYDFSHFKKGFDNIEDIFEFITSSKYFKKDMFIFENLNHINKSRNKRRKSYLYFLEYIENKKTLDNFNDLNVNNSLQLINDFFPEANLIGRIEELKEKDRINTIIKDKFNGKIIMSIYPELKGKELGFYLEGFKKQFYNFDNYVLSETEEQIISDFKIFYEKVRGSI